MVREEVSILVVDDVNTMRIQIRDLLRSFGFRKITVASSGDEAKLLMEQHSFHLILCDWHMSPTDGLEVLRYVRNHPQYKEVPFIMVSAESTVDKVLEAIKAGVDDYLVKPLTPIQIENKVYGVLLKKRVLT